MYRVGWPFWKFFLRRGWTLKIKILFTYDDEAEVFIAKSNDLQGLMCEAQTFPELKKEIEWCINALLEHHVHSEYKHPIADMEFSDAGLLAA